MIYRVQIRREGAESTGYFYFGNKKDAQKVFAETKKEALESDEIETMKTPKNKKEVLRMLSRWASHPVFG
jgi:hypothetical protein